MDITWEDPLCGEGNNCFRLGTDPHGNAHIAVTGREANPLSAPHDALRGLIHAVKAGEADHLLRRGGRAASGGSES